MIFNEYVMCCDVGLAIFSDCIVIFNEHVFSLFEKRREEGEKFFSLSLVITLKYKSHSRIIYHVYVLIKSCIISYILIKL